MSDDLSRTLADNGKALYRIAWRILGRAEEVDDALQDVVLQAMKISNREPVQTWVGLLKRLTVCRSLDQLRKRKSQQSFLESDFPSVQHSPVEDAIGRELENRLRESLVELPARQAEVFSLRYFDSCSNLEIAKSLRISTAAVATALRSARLRLAQLLEIETRRGKS